MTQARLGVGFHSIGLAALLGMAGCLGQSPTPERQDNHALLTRPGSDFTDFEERAMSELEPKRLRTLRLAARLKGRNSGDPEYPADYGAFLQAQEDYWATYDRLAAEYEKLVNQSSSGR